MSVKSITSSNNSTMRMGVVTMNNQRYVAILHFRDEDGTPRDITKAMEKAKRAYADLFQKVLDESTARPGALIEEVNGRGFTIKDSDPASHNDKSELAWQNFIKFLNHPTLLEEVLEEVKGPSVQLVKALGRDEIELAQGIQEKFDAQFDEEAVELPRNTLDENEKALLRRLGFDKLEQGLLDNAQYNDFVSELKTLMLTKV